MNEKIRWGIAGTGRIAEQFAADLAHVTNGHPAAVSSRKPESADEFALRHGVDKAYGGYGQLLEDAEVDAVYIASPHVLHKEHALQAIAAGKHVLCEKPFTMNAAEARNVFAAAEGRGLFVMEAMWTYFLPAIRKALEWVEQGRIGRIRQIKADLGYPQLPYDPGRREYAAELGGGCLLEMGIYPIALAWLFLQRDPDDIQLIARKAPNGVEDDLQMLFDYGGNAEGFSATLATSFRSKLQNSAYIIGEESYIAIPDFFRARECFLYRLDDCIEHFDDGRDSLGLNYETRAAGEDILAGRQQNAIMPWDTTIRLQDHMERVRTLI